jgi:hypothetical protein
MMPHSMCRGVVRLVRHIVEGGPSVPTGKPNIVVRWGDDIGITNR